MKITAFYPAVITNNAEAVIASMEKFGFRVIHKRKRIIDDCKIECVLENENGGRMDVVCDPEVAADYYVTRVNVDDFDEAMKMYAEDGFTVLKGPHILPDSKNAVLVSPGNLQIMLMQHIKEQ